MYIHDKWVRTQPGEPEPEELLDEYLLTWQNVQNKIQCFASKYALNNWFEDMRSAKRERPGSLSQYKRSSKKNVSLLDCFRFPFAVFIARQEKDCPDDPVDDRMCEPDSVNAKMKILRNEDAQKDSADPHRDRAYDHRIGRIAGGS